MFNFSAARGAQNGANIGAKREKNNMKNRRNFHHPFGCEKSLKIDENPFENGPKMDEKTGLRAATQNIENVLPAKAGTLFLMFRGVPNP